MSGGDVRMSLANNEYGNEDDDDDNWIYCIYIHVASNFNLAFLFM